MSEPTYRNRDELEALIKNLEVESSLDFHVDQRNSHVSYHYTLTRWAHGLVVSCRAENHDINTGYDGSEDYDERPISEADALGMFDGAELEGGP